MLKPAALRAHLAAATPELRRDPDKLTVFVENGRIAAAGTGSLSFEYRYTLKVVVLDYSSHADAILVPLLAWLARNQVEAFDNPNLRDNAIKFEAEFLNKETMDLSISVELTERVIVAAGPDPADAATARRFDVKHIGEPPRPGDIEKAERWALYLRDQLLAEWEFRPQLY